MGISIHPSEAISDNVCAVCGDCLEGDSAYFTVTLESVITRQTKCPPLHRKCAVALAKEKFTIHAIWESGYSFDGMPEPTFYLEKSVSDLEFDGAGDCSNEGIRQALAHTWMQLRQARGEEVITFPMGTAAKALLPKRPVVSGLTHSFAGVTA